MSFIELTTKNGQRKFLTPAERSRLISATSQLPPKSRTFCLMLIHTGCLISEALLMNYQSIDLHRKKVTITTLKKRNKSKSTLRQVPLSDWYLEELKSVHGLGNQNTAVSDIRLWKWGRTSSFRRIKKIMRIAEIEGVQATYFGIRHAFALHCVKRDIPIHLLKRWMGHASIESTAVYFEREVANERAIAERMWV